MAVSRTSAHQKRTLLWSYTSRMQALNDAWTATCCLVRKLPSRDLQHHDFVDFAEYDGLLLMA
ncbi:MAG: hypothetical protein WAK86_14395 [Pseudonocardiaceae bacterium]